MEHDLGVIDKKLEQKRRSEPLGWNKQKWCKDGGSKMVEQKTVWSKNLDEKSLKEQNLSSKKME